MLLEKALFCSDSWKEPDKAAADWVPMLFEKVQ